jgi:hypothetical protein
VPPFLSARSRELHTHPAHQHQNPFVQGPPSTNWVPLVLASEQQPLPTGREHPYHAGCHYAGRKVLTAPLRARSAGHQHRKTRGHSYRG